jgi:glycosyltransferase involved in cell wall biosynthesis
MLAYNLWRAQLHFIWQSPRLYLRLLIDLLRQPHRRQPLASLVKRLVIFLKAITVAYHLEGSDVQLIHAHFAWLSGAAAIIISRLLDLPFTVTVHAFDIFSHKNDLLRLVCKEANHVIAISENNKQQIEALEICPANKISVIHCGVDLEEIKKLPQIKVEHDINAPLRLLSVGSLVCKKGHTYLVDACKLLLNRGQNFECSIIGSGPDEAELRRKIESYGLQNRVKLLGALSHPEITQIYGQYDVFALASIIAPNGDRDGIPVVLMEAGAFCLPLVSTNVSGIPELVHHGKTGLLVPPGDPAALADAINTLAVDTALRKHLGQNACTLVEAEYNSEINTLRLKSLFHETISMVKNKRYVT